MLVTMTNDVGFTDLDPGGWVKGGGSITSPPPHTHTHTHIHILISYDLSSALARPYEPGSMNATNMSNSLYRWPRVGLWPVIGCV